VQLSPERGQAREGKVGIGMAAQPDRTEDRQAS
jgi:hypothetical protein